MIVDKSVKVSVNPKNMKYYNQYFTNIKVGQILDVDINILNKNSNLKVLSKCDRCGKEKYITFNSIKNRKNKDKYYCTKCTRVIYSTKKINEDDVIKLYTIDKMTIIDISRKIKIGTKAISRFLKSKNIEITLSDRIYENKYVFTDEHKKKISVIGKRRVGTKNKPITNYKNMAAHLRYDVDYLWLMQFNDFEKLKLLNLSITRGRTVNFDTQTYKEYIIKFYYDKKFNKIYDKWIFNNKDSWLKPSLDHITPTSMNYTSAKD